MVATCHWTSLLQVCGVCALPTAIADDPDIRQLVLELKANNKKANGTVPEDTGVEEEEVALERKRSQSRR